MTSRGCTPADLFASASDLFCDIAWTWWHNESLKGTFSSWDELVHHLRLAFLRENYDRNLMDEIRSRKQGQNESVTVFISHLESLFNRLTDCKLSEKDKVDIILRNLQPDYIKALALSDVNSLSQLTSLCRKLEDSFLTCQSHKPRARDSSVSFCSVSSSVSPKSQILCWNCDKVGHSFSQCHSFRKRFCFNCGKKNVVRSNCPNCSPKNAQRPEGSTPSAQGPSHGQSAKVEKQHRTTKGQTPGPSRI